MSIRKYEIFVMLLMLILWQILKCNIIHAQFKVHHLPGFEGPLPFSLETGYIGVKENEEQLFYYFFESENNPKEDPLILWFTGGPLCSGMSTIFYEIGPLQLEENNYNEESLRVILRQYPWSKISNMIFVDLPIGTGFSYAKSHHSNYSGDLKASSSAHEFIRKWLVVHPQFYSNSLYVGGDSYSGFTLPIYFEEMSNGNEEGMKPFLNLKGYLLGNPATDRSIDGNTQISFSRGMGLISKEMFESLQRTCKGNYRAIDPSNIECKRNMDNFYDVLYGIQMNNVLEDFCNVDYLRVHRLSKFKRRMTIETNDGFYQAKHFGAYNCRKEGYKLAIYYMNDKNVREAFHVRKESPNWVRCNHAYNYSREVVSSTIYHAKLSFKGFRSLIYSGDHDFIVPFFGTEAWIKSLNYSIRDDWRKWMVDGQIAGFTRTYSNDMTYATVKGAGHTAPEYKPKQCFHMFKRWILGEAL